jgi:hypothetical protein
LANNSGSQAGALEPKDISWVRFNPISEGGMRFAFPPYSILLQIGVKCVHKSAARGEGTIREETFKNCFKRDKKVLNSGSAWARAIEVNPKTKVSNKATTNLDLHFMAYLFKPLFQIAGHGMPHQNKIIGWRVECQPGEMPDGDASRALSESRWERPGH